jgi:hypothetical protein
LSVYVAWRSTQTDVQVLELVQWTVVLLGLVATSLLIDRFVRIRVMSAKVNGIARLFDAFMRDRIRAADFFADHEPDLTQDVTSADSIFVFAVNGQAFLVEYKTLLMERVLEGAELRLLAVDPDSESARRIANPDKELSHDYLKATSKIARQTLVWMHSQKGATGSVELRYIDAIPMFSAYLFNGETPRARMLLTFYRQKWGHGRRPSAMLDRSRDAGWFDYYKDQLDESWVEGKPVNLDASNSPLAP